MLWHTALQKSLHYVCIVFLHDVQHRYPALIADFERACDDLHDNRKVQKRSVLTKKVLLKVLVKVWHTFGVHLLVLVLPILFS